MNIGSGNPSARRFAGKDCVVTGAGGGIGRAVALRLAAEGGRIAVLDINEDGARETLKLCCGQGLAAQIDVRSEASVAAVATPHGLACLTITTAGSANSATHSIAASVSLKLL